MYVYIIKQTTRHCDLGGNREDAWGRLYAVTTGNGAFPGRDIGRRRRSYRKVRAERCSLSGRDFRRTFAEIFLNIYPRV